MTNRSTSPLKHLKLSAPKARWRRQVKWSRRSWVRKWSCQLCSDSTQWPTKTSQTSRRITRRSSKMPNWPSPSYSPNAKTSSNCLTCVTSSYVISAFQLKMTPLSRNWQHWTTLWWPNTRSGRILWLTRISTVSDCSGRPKTLKTRAHLSWFKA